jgi:hypothetical protein
MFTYEDEADFEESMVFDVDKAEEAKNAVLNAKMLVDAGER